MRIILRQLRDWGLRLCCMTAARPIRCPMMRTTYTRIYSSHSPYPSINWLSTSPAHSPPLMTSEPMKEFGYPSSCCNGGTFTPTNPVRPRQSDYVGAVPRFNCGPPSQSLETRAHNDCEVIEKEIEPRSKPRSATPAVLTAHHCVDRPGGLDIGTKGDSYDGLESNQQLSEPFTSSFRQRRRPRAALACDKCRKRKARVRLIRMAHSWLTASASVAIRAIVALSDR